MVSERNGEQTRERLLQAAFEEMHQHGYQGLRIDAILAKTHLAKGALYHHFPNKLALGYAIVDEVLLKQVQQHWWEPMAHADDPLASMQALLRADCQRFEQDEVFQGCPVNNLAQEMAALDEGFQSRLLQVMQVWIGAFAQAFERARDRGLVAAGLDPQLTAIYVVSSFQGLMSTAKCMQSAAMLVQLVGQLCNYIESLRTKQQ
jgi:TetR/AcrR family transcriptional regulator, transcriptional repressor for nem operon